MAMICFSITYYHRFHPVSWFSIMTGPMILFFLVLAILDIKKHYKTLNWIDSISDGALFQLRGWVSPDSFLVAQLISNKKKVDGG